MQHLHHDNSSIKIADKKLEECRNGGCSLIDYKFAISDAWKEKNRAKVVYINNKSSYDKKISNVRKEERKKHNSDRTTKSVLNKIYIKDKTNIDLQKEYIDYLEDEIERFVFMSKALDSDRIQDNVDRKYTNDLSFNENTWFD